MAMSSGGGGSLTNDINVTPMIDVLLVLLIIFMMIIPMSRRALDLQLPDPDAQQTSEKPPPQIVLEVAANETYLLNKEPIPANQLYERLKKVYDERPEKIIFIKGDPKLKYQEVIKAMDIARGAGVKVIGVPPRDVK